jgi:putative DNA primase/helicase
MTKKRSTKSLPSLPKQSKRTKHQQGPPSPKAGNPPKLAQFHRTDVGNAELFAALFADKLLYDHARKRWLGWQDHWWTEDTNGGVQRLARCVPRWRAARAAPEIENPEERHEEFKWARRSESRPRLDAILKLAESERQLSDEGTHWDTDPWLLGVANGAVDLRTGKLRDGKQSDRITLHTDLVFDPRSECPRWEQFLDEIFGDDQELNGFIQRAIGYSITGDTTEQVLFLCYGTGANGKSTFLEVLRHVLGGYACNLPFSAFELRNRSTIPNDIAGLVARRFVTALETNESVQLNEARIKTVTGCDPITARFLYKEHFTFIPLAKFWLAFNQKPEVADDSEGYWRRVRLIPFEQQFPKGKADEQLLSKLKAEAPGVLAWAVRGCLEWRRNGLGLPDVVEAASLAYREESDPIREFLDERCELGAGFSVTAANVWREYQSWAQLNGDRLLKRKQLTRHLQTRGLRKEQVGHAKTWTWLGLRLKRFPHPPADVRADADVKLPLLVN